MSKGKRLTSTVTSESTVHLGIEEFEVPNPGPDEVLIAVAVSYTHLTLPTTPYV